MPDRNPTAAPSDPSPYFQGFTPARPDPLTSGFPGVAPGSGLALPPETGAGTGAAMPVDLSPVGMFMGADLVVQSVMLLLLAASVVTWTIGLLKALQLGLALRRSRRLLGVLTDADSLTGATRASLALGGPERSLLALSLDEIGRSATPALPHLIRPLDSQKGLLERLSSVLERMESAAGRKASLGMGFLATVGATSPFIGLFGTVWGIMNSFIGISRAQTTNLAVVAPGIAEALLATALGLVAAIPAVILYNLFSRGATGYGATLRDVSSAILRLVSRDLDRGALDTAALEDARTALLRRD
ncbi:tonB-system energizer ExbB [Phaeovibrio sulfidiphilus]|uniref:Biopolymer transport protein ExbB n=1 Tax=Phaeovibrio sulfidiphilus TaxID=1220600 RepID=A0A8J6YMQ9_9PROT|nr:tonB-system energizer ExbB [Phaeovibrio sulfidiphilus]MBE1236729.1 tonB-system energizer ExbB [Phaeovibrio sulfidiphilus]